MDQPVQDGVGQSGVAKVLVPMIQRQLTGEQSGAFPTPVFQQFQQVPPGFIGEGIHSPVVKNQQVDFGQAAQDCSIASIPFGQTKFRKQSSDTMILHPVAQPASLVAKRTSPIGFAHAGWAGEDEIEMSANPFT